MEYTYINRSSDVMDIQEYGIKKGGYFPPYELRILPNTIPLKLCIEFGQLFRYYSENDLEHEL